MTRNKDGLTEGAQTSSLVMDARVKLGHDKGEL